MQHSTIWNEDYLSSISNIQLLDMKFNILYKQHSTIGYESLIKLL